MASDGGEAPAEVQAGKDIQLRAQLTYSDGSKGDPLGSSAEWASDKEAVATVDAGTVHGVAAGTANISATAEGKTASIAVTVTAPAGA